VIVFDFITIYSIILLDIASGIVVQQVHRLEKTLDNEGRGYDHSFLS
jgi:hypothetical protein